MRIHCIPKEFFYLAKHKPVVISAAADQRMQKLNLWNTLKEKGVGETEISLLLRVSRATRYRWRKRLEEKGPKGLEEKSRRPHRVRQPMWWGTELSEAVLGLREEYPGWGKDKLVVLLNRQGWKTSSSTVGRILVDLKRHGVLHEPPRGVSEGQETETKKTLRHTKTQGLHNKRTWRPGSGGHVRCSTS